MTNETIIKIAIIFCYYHLSGQATTNILRLTKGNTSTVSHSKCYCGSCNGTISPFMQLPIISFIIAKGKCKKCGAKIPVGGLVLELAILTGMSVITALSGFSMVGILLSFLYYEVVRVVVIAVSGKREKDFKKQYAIAVLLNSVFFLLLEFIGFLGTIV